MNAMQRQLALLAGVALMQTAGVTRAADEYQAHCLYLGEDPSGETNWSHTVRGLAHDDANWYITQERALWRVPVGLDLDSISSGSAGVQRRTTFPELLLDANDTWLWGDPCVHRYGGVDYLIIPYLVISGGDHYHLLAVFNADTLTAVARVNLPDLSYYASAVDLVGNLYLSFSTGTGFVRRWTIDWPTLHQSGTLTLQFDANIDLFDEGGTALLELPGGESGLELTPDDRYLYVVADDIHIFDMQTRRRIHRSINSTTGFFPFNWDDSASAPPEESTEGLTIWDLEGTASPHVGQLHVIVRDWDFDPDDDDVFLKHYTARIEVSAGAPAPWTGAPWDPFATVAAAVSAAWFGSEIRIDAGLYNEVMTINQRVRLTSAGGAARIGG